MNTIQAVQLLDECTGDDIWSIEYCQEKNIPTDWIESLRDVFESDLSRDTNTIYIGDRRLNHYEGVRDVDLAIKLAEYLGVDTAALISIQPNRRRLVQSLQEAVEEG
jgi:hypothetical protein